MKGTLHTAEEKPAQESKDSQREFELEGRKLNTEESAASPAVSPGSTNSFRTGISRPHAADCIQHNTRFCSEVHCHSPAVHLHVVWVNLATVMTQSKLFSCVKFPTVHLPEICASFVNVNIYNDKSKYSQSHTPVSKP